MEKKKIWIIAAIAIIIIILVIAGIMIKGKKIKQIIVPIFSDRTTSSENSIDIIINDAVTSEIDDYSTISEEEIIPAPQ